MVLQGAWPGTVYAVLCNEDARACAGVERCDNVCQLWVRPDLDRLASKQGVSEGRMKGPQPQVCQVDQAL